MVATFVVLALVAMKSGELLFCDAYKGLDSFQMKQLFGDYALTIV